MPDAHGIGVTVRNQLNRVITLEVTPRDVSCTLWSGVGSPTALNGVTIAPGERRGVWLSVVGNTVVGFPLTFLVDNKSVTTMPYAVQADGSEERQYIVDPQTGTPQCSRVDRWPFDIDGASAQARISCSGDLTVDIEYRL